jgi:hypothetical protein
MHILDSQSVAQLGQYVTSLATVVLLIPKLKRPLNVLRRHLPKGVIPRATALLCKARDALAKELTPTWHWPWATTLQKFIFCVTFYMLALYCVTLFIADGFLIVFGDAVVWKRCAATLVGGVLCLVARWQLIQADTLRRELRDGYGR